MTENVNDSTLIFVSGGAKSGKTRHGLKCAENWQGKLLYVATAEAGDDEMKRRIAAHQEERGPRWSTLEEPLDLAKAVKNADGYCAALIDCLTLWTSNLLHHFGDDPAAIEERVAAFLEALRARRTNIVVVTNEVGLGIVPANALARQFRDLAGSINQRVAAVADEAVLVVSGRTLKLN
jgi:adenosylcobinamide kinase/adenosylcobinamide-phosphate guanylyltransferase